jgi:hypothetical protein
MIDPNDPTQQPTIIGWCIAGFIMLPYAMAASVEYMADVWAVPTFILSLIAWFGTIAVGGETTSMYFKQKNK